MSDKATPFRYSMVPNLANALGVEHQFSVTTSAWTNETVERMMRDVIHWAKAMFNDTERRPPNAWDLVLSAVQSALNTAWRKRLQTTLHNVMMLREPRTAFTALIEGDDEGFVSARSTETGCSS